MDLPRVTQILSPFTSFDKVPSEILHKAATRGTSVHALCAAIAKDAWVPDGMVEEEYKGYIASFRSWAETQVEKFVIIERRFGDEALGFTGQVDFVILGKDGELYLVDLKTSSTHYKTYPVQMAAYHQLLRENNIDTRGSFLVYLDKEGAFPDIDFIEDHEEGYNVFLSALDCYKYFNRRKKHGRSKDECIPENTSSDGRTRLHTEGAEDGQRAI
jgi:PD-(D/E)XK nuclease superfamily